MPGRWVMLQRSGPLSLTDGFRRGVRGGSTNGTEKNHHLLLGVCLLVAPQPRSQSRCCRAPSEPRPKTGIKLKIKLNGAVVGAKSRNPSAPPTAPPGRLVREIPSERQGQTLPRSPSNALSQQISPLKGLASLNGVGS
jgi:hypothetical protein